MPPSEPAFYAQALRRIGWTILALGALGAAALTAVRGLRSGLAFLIGAAFSYASFRGWQHAVSALAPAAKPRKAWRFILRIVLLAALACAIIKFLGLNVAAAVTGLLVSAAAVILEIVYELIYARA